MPKTANQWPSMAISLSRALSRALSRSCCTTTATFSVPPPPPSFPLKHVTRSNFESALADLRGLVRAADFVAIDLEMTGVTSAPWRESFEFDRFDVMYLKVKDSAEKFAVVQFGVCPFRWDSQSLSFIAHPHNFFVFPRQELVVDGSSYEFLCQTSSIDFLAKYQFDFNACINGGISYLSRVQEDEAVKRLNLLYDDCQLGSQHRLKEVRDTPLVSMTDVFFSERMKIRLGEWRDELLRDRNSGSPIKRTLNDSNQPFQTIFFKMRPALALNGFTSHQLKLIQSVSKKHFKDLSYICMNGEGSSSQHLVVYTDSEHDKDLLMKEVKDEHRKGEEMKIKNTIGFRHVIDLLSSEQKLIVGHNCFLDVAHIYSKFFGPLPSTSEKFVTSVNKYFPQIIDTKVLLNANAMLQLRMKKSNTSLSSAFSSLCPHIALGSQASDLFFQSHVNVEVQVDETRSSIWSSGAKHEAGYDAFMTGCIFAQACSHLGVDLKVFSPTEHLANSEMFRKHMNLLYLSWTNGDIIDLSTGHRTTGILLSRNLKKRYPKILFENIVLVWGFPSKVKATEIKECVCKVFGPTSVTSIYHLDGTAVFIQFSSTKMVSEFLVLKETLERNDNAISVLHPLSKLLEGGNTHAADYETYKEICSSPISKVLFADQAEAVGIKWKTKLKESEAEVKESEVEARAHECSHKESTENTDSDSMQKKLRKTDYAIRSSGHDIDESIYGTEIKQIGAANL